MILIKDLFTNRECIRLKHFIMSNYGIYYTLYSKISLKRDTNTNKHILDSRLNDVQLNPYNKKYESIHNVGEYLSFDYKRIIDLLQKINNEVKKINNDLDINDIFIKRWGGINNSFYAKNFKHELTIFTNNDKAVSTINYQFGNHIVLFFNETCQVFYDNINSYKFNQSVICPKGSVLFLEKEHFILKKHSLMFTLGLSYINKVSNIIDVISNKKTLYKDI